jgi:hypothetical protein
MRKPDNIPIEDPIINLFVYYTLSDIGENLEWNYGECNFPGGWNIVGMGLNEYRINDVIYYSKEQHLIPASKKDELFDKLVAFFEKQYENGIVKRFSITEEQ